MLRELGGRDDDLSRAHIVVWDEYHFKQALSYFIIINDIWYLID